MTEKNNAGFLKIVVLIYAVVCLVYGLGFAIVPDSLVELSGSEPVFHGWLRWPGGVLIALGIGAILVFLKPICYHNRDWITSGRACAALGMDHHRGRSKCMVYCVPGYSFTGRGGTAYLEPPGGKNDPLS
jgi:hypothetical protein